MKNNNLIDDLSKDLTPWKKMDSLPLFFLKWLGISIIFFGVNYFWMPLRSDLPVVVNHKLFYAENVLWIVLAISSSFALYKSAFPDIKNKTFSSISIISLISLIALSMKGSESLLGEIPHELDLWRGGCGLIISFITILQTPLLGLWARKGAPSNPGMCGAWAALSSASVGCLLMQFICHQHTSAHLLIWHFLPLTLMCAASYFIAVKILRW